MRKSFVVGLATAALMAGSALSAQALEYSPNPVHQGQDLTVVSTEQYPAGTYRVSLCSNESILLLGQKVPACTKGVTVVTNSTEKITAVIPKVRRFGNKNVHAFLGGDSLFDCEKKGQCQILIVDHSGLSKTMLESKDIVVEEA